jgi:hypothetical protein
MTAASRMQSRTATAIDALEPDYSARNDRYLTPLPMIRALGTFDLDPCGAPGHGTAREVWTPETVGDGLSMPWAGRVWLNPPYGRTMGDWVERLADHGHGTALLFARTDTGVFQRHVFPRATALLFVERRIRFAVPENRRSLGDRGEGSAPSVLIAFGNADAALLKRSGIRGAYIDIERGRA